MKSFLRLASTLCLLFMIPALSFAQLSITFSTSAYVSPPEVSAVINDPTDPAKTLGVVVSIKEGGNAIAAADYTLTASSSKTSVIPNANIAITKSDGQANVKVTSTGVGYANVTLTLTKGSNSKTLVINYAVSAAATNPAITHFHTGFSDASAAIALDDNYMIVADDEHNTFYVHHRTNSGLWNASYNYNNGLGLTDGSAGDYKEVDVEAAVRSKTNANRIYWLGSMSNSSSFNDKPNRNRIFVTDYSGTAPAVNLQFRGYYSTLREKLIAWGNSYGYNLTASAAEGKDPKAIDGFNIEGMCFGPDNTTLYICFRAPLVPITNRTKALIAPIQNFETWFNLGSPTGNPVIGAPIEISLGGRSIRDIIPVAAGGYLIVAGSYGTANTPAIYKWTGVATDQPVLQPGFNVSGLNLEAVLEVNEGGQPSANKYQFISDDGGTEYYGDGKESKDLSQPTFQKYRSDVITNTTALPIVLESFTVRAESNSSLLSWKVAQNSNVASFEILRSYTGTDFKNIAAVAATTGTTMFNYADPAVAGSATTYYQLKLLMRDGAVYYSPVRIVSAARNDMVKVYPNPVVDGKFSISTNHTGSKQVRVINSNGVVVKTVSFAVSSVDVDVRGLGAGSYKVVVSGVGGVVSVKNVLIIK